MALDAGRGLRVLAVDDEGQALAHLARLLRRSHDIGEVTLAYDGTEALRILNRRSDLDLVLADIAMPDLDGIELAAVLAHYRSPPALVFVTAHEEHALKAFELGAVDYLLKPVSLARLTAALERVAVVTERAAAAERVAGATERPDPAADRSRAVVNRPRSPGDGHPPAERRRSGVPGADLSRLASRLGGRTTFVDRDTVRFARCEGDYVRVHTRDGAHLVRESISALSVAWAGHGFVRVHRSFLVRLTAVAEVRAVNGQRSVVVDGREFPVSRRYWRLLADGLTGIPF
ncbi:MAG: LytR/AlgR family response regulator transcription factor [Kineosporiaceae bacterium]